MTIERDAVLPAIYAGVASGMSLDRVLREGANMPHPATFWRWHMDDEAIRDNLARARVNGVEAQLEQASDIADTPMIGETKTVKGDGTVEVRSGDMLEHRKLQVQTRFKRAEMIAPRKYGPRMDLTTNGDSLPAPDTAAAAASVAALVAAWQQRKLAALDDEG